MVKNGPGEMEKQHDYIERIKIPLNSDLPLFDENKCQFIDNRLANNSLKDNIVNEFLTLLCCCHSIIPEYPNNNNKKDYNNIIYNASSPNEKALVSLAKNLHYFFNDAHVHMLNYHNKNIDGNRFYE